MNTPRTLPPQVLFIISDRSSYSDSPQHPFHILNISANISIVLSIIANNILGTSFSLSFLCLEKIFIKQRIQFFQHIAVSWLGGVGYLAPSWELHLVPSVQCRRPQVPFLFCASGGLLSVLCPVYCLHTKAIQINENQENCQKKVRWVRMMLMWHVLFRRLLFCGFHVCQTNTKTNTKLWN